MTPRITRRRALASIGTAGLGAIVAAACGADEQSSRSSLTSSSSPSVPGDGTAASTSLTGDMFDSATTCSLAPERTEGPFYFDADGIAEFLTIYPAWYPGRTVHIHAKVHLDRATLLTTQLYFDDRITDEAMSEAPYSTRGDRDTENADDSIFDDGVVLAASADGAGYLGLITLDVDTA